MEGPGKYLDLDALAVVNEELVLLGVYPRKIMWFSLEGEFLRELTLKPPLVRVCFLNLTTAIIYTARLEI